MRRILPPTLLTTLLLVFLEMLGQLHWIETSLIPTPSLVFISYYEHYHDYASAFWETLQASLFGFFLAAFAGLLMASLLSFSIFARQAVLPFALFFQTVPIIAIAPLLVIYFGFGSATVIASSAIVSVFPVLANVLLGLISLDPGEEELFTIYGASPSQVFWKLRLPRAYPSLYAGLRVSAGLAVIGAVAGEFVAGGGLGAMIDSARTQQRIDLVFGCLFLLSSIGLLLIGGIQFAHLQLCRYRPYGIQIRN